MRRGVRSAVLGEHGVTHPCKARGAGGGHPGVRRRSERAAGAGDLPARTCASIEGFAISTRAVRVGTVLPMERHLEGTVALVTGASSGIGEKTALALADAGAQVAVVARRGDRLRELVKGVGLAPC